MFGSQKNYKKIKQKERNFLQRIGRLVPNMGKWGQVMRARRKSLLQLSLDPGIDRPLWSRPFRELNDIFYIT